jgi:drug/metabolite transporter (DMT)-like permease
MHLFAEARVVREEKVSHVILSLQIPPLLLLPFTILLPLPEIESLGYLAIGGFLLALGNTFLYYSFDSIPAHRSLIIKPLSTVMAALLGVTLLGDPWTTSLLIGGVLVITATVMVGFGEQKTRSSN